LSGGESSLIGLEKDLLSSELTKSNKYRGEVTLTGDKSLSHRAIIFASLANGKSIIRNLLLSGDTRATINAFVSMGIKIEINKDSVIIYGKGLKGLKEPAKPIYCANSGTTARLLIGVLTGQNFTSTLTGSDQLSKRPMDRVSSPLNEIGCKVKSNDGKLPIIINPSSINKFTVNTSSPSAQVKSSLILAAMYSDEPVVIIEDDATRDHTEKVLAYLGVNLVRMGNTVTVPPVVEIPNFSESIPSDISSASFLIALGVLIDSSIKLCNVLLNERRMGFIKALMQMGARINVQNVSTQFGEQVGDLEIKKSNLKGIKIEKKEIPSIIDELPIFALVASQAEGSTTVEGAGELRVKESDRLEAIYNLLLSIGIEVETSGDGFVINGPQEIQSGQIETYGDHRIAMVAVIASLISEKDIQPDNIECINDSYPSFFSDLKSIGLDSL
jgi:3-phosphoshikimate 1-carboxyvinyltransferase